MVQKRKLKNGKDVFVARWRDPDGRSRSRSFPTHRQARNEERAHKLAVAEGRYTDPKRGQLQFGAWWERWLNDTAPALAPSTLDQRTRLGAKHLVPELGGYPLADITAADIRRLLTEKAYGPLAPATVDKLAGILHVYFEDAIDEGLVDANPVRRARRRTRRPQRPVTASQRRALSVPQVMALADAIRPEYRALVWVMAVGGLRVGEALGLRRDRVQGSQLVVDRQVVSVSAPVETGSLKTQNSHRSFTMPRVLELEILRHVTEVGITSGLLFTAPKGGLVDRRLFRSRMLIPAAEASVGLPLTNHDLRHTANTLMREAGIPDWVIAARMGHGGRGMTDLYTHISDEADAEAAAQLNALFRQHGGFLGDLRLVR